MADSTHIAILDYGIGNVRSIANAFKSIGAQTTLTADRARILDSDACVLPGVGAFGAGMQKLSDQGLVEVISDYIATGKPFLGICLGMQMLLDESDEFGHTAGLGLIPGKVRRLDVPDQRLPHVSWNGIHPPTEERWENTLLASTPPGTDVYFVHSYAAYPTYEEHVLAQTRYAQHTYCSAVQKDNIVGVQFHPEKSAQAGLSILKTFISGAKLTR